MTKDSKRRAEERQQEKEQQQQQQGKPTQSPLHPLDPSIPPPSSQSPESLEWDTGLLLLVPLRLGLDKFNEDYVDGVARSFWIPQSVGILGGRPRGARWFYGAYADGSKVLGLDPHTVQAAPQRKQLHAPAGTHATLKHHNMVVDLSDEYMRSVHTPYPEVFQLNKMDPSIAIGFYCRDKREFAELEASLQQLKAHSPASSPDLFTVADNAPDYLSSAVNDMMLGDLDDDGTGAVVDDESDDDEYVLL
jgi:cysteine protease ATG4